MQVATVSTASAGGFPGELAGGVRGEEKTQRLERLENGEKPDGYSLTGTEVDGIVLVGTFGQRNN